MKIGVPEAAPSNNVRHDRSFIASISPNTSLAVTPVAFNNRAQHSSSRGPSNGCSENLAGVVAQGLVVHLLARVRHRCSELVPGCENLFRVSADEGRKRHVQAFHVDAERNATPLPLSLNCQTMLVPAGTTVHDPALNNQRDRPADNAVTNP